MGNPLEGSQLSDWWRSHIPSSTPFRIGLGGGGLSRKPLGLLSALIGADILRPAHWVTPVGGIDVDLLIACDLVAELTASYVGLEQFGLAPHFRAARQAGTLRFNEWSEFAVVAGLRAAGARLPFYPARLGGDVVARAGFATFPAPYTGEILVAVPPLPLDVALLHVDVADRAGNACILGDVHVDPLLARVARVTLISAGRLVDTDELHEIAGRSGCEILSVDVDAVYELPGGYGIGCAPPAKPLDGTLIGAYIAAAKAHLAGDAEPSALLAAVRGEAQ